MKKALYVVLVLLVAITGCSRDESKKVVAKVGSRKITVGDLQETYMRVTPAYLPQAAGEEGKKQFLDDLIKKELLILDAYDNKLDKDEETLSGMKRMEEQVLLRELYNDEIVEKSKVIDKEVKQRYEEMARQEEVHARHIVVSDSLLAQNIVKQARAGMNFGDLAKRYSEDASTASLGGDLGFFAKEPQDTSEFFQWAYRLQPGQISDAFRTPFGWHIVKVEERRKRQLEPYDKLKARLESMLIMEKKRDLATKFLDKTRKDHNFELKNDGIKMLAQAIWACSTEVGATPKAISSHFTADQLGTVLATTKEGKYTIADFVKSLELAGIGQLPPNASLDEISGMVESEAITAPLAEEAKQIKLDKKASVKKDLDKLKEEKMVEILYQRQIRDSVKVSDQDIFNYYTENKDDYGTPAVFTFRKLLVEKKTAADSLAALARAGKDFRRLVRENSIDPTTKPRDGEWQTSPGRDAAIDSLTKNLKVGGIAGPGETREGFVILQLLSEKPPVPTPINLAWPHVDRDVRAKKEEAALEGLLAKLREKYKPVINEKVLASVKLGAPVEQPAVKGAEKAKGTEQKKEKTK